MSTYIDCIVGSTSLVGTNPRGSYPLGFGNYFSFADEFLGYVRCINMWAENLDFLKDEGHFDSGVIEVQLFGPMYNDCPIWAIVVDDRVPLSFLNKEFCFTGHYIPESKNLQQMVDFYDDYLYHRSIE